MKPKSLNKKLSLSVFFVALILGIITSIISFGIELDRSKQQVEVMINQLLDTVEGTAAIAAYSRNKQIAKDALEGLLKNDVVYKARIESNADFNFELSKSNLVTNEKLIIRPLVSPFGDEQVIGHLSIQPAAKFKLIEAEYGAISNALNSILIIAVTSITIFLIIHSNISKPLTHVSNTLHAIKAGRTQRIPLLNNNKNDELGRLVFDINNLLEVLEEKYHEELTLRKKVELIEQQLRNIFNSTSAGLFLLNSSSNLLTFNKTFEKILKNTIPGVSPQNNFLSYFNAQKELSDLIIEVLETGELRTKDFSLHVAEDDSLVWVNCSLSIVINESYETLIEGVIFDVTKRVETEKAIAYEANHDKLTGLLRRHAAQQAYLNCLNTFEDFRASFLFLDLDGFKQANDTYGHLAGDKVLIITSKRLAYCVRDTDITCRLGGDEFLIILINCSIENVFQIAKKTISAIRKNYRISDNINIEIGVSIGIAHSDEKSKDFDALIQTADEAMYIVKKQGKNGYCVSNGERKVYKVSN